MYNEDNYIINITRVIQALTIKLAIINITLPDLIKYKKLTVNKIKLLNKYIKCKIGCNNTQKKFVADLAKLQTIKLKFAIKIRSRCDENFISGYGTSMVEGGSLRPRTNLVRQRRAKKNDEVNNNKSLTNRVKWQDMQSAFESRIRTGVVINITHKDIHNFFVDVKTMITKRITNLRKSMRSFKVNLCYTGNFTQPSSLIEELKYFSTKNEIIVQGTNVGTALDSLFAQIFIKLQEQADRLSGWAQNGIVNMVVAIVKYSPLNGGVSSYVQLPEFYRNNRNILNIRNNDARCFAWCCLAKLYPCDGGDPRNVDSYPQSIHDFLNFRNIEFPIKITDLNKFEKQNQNLSINVYAIDEKVENSIYPVYISNNLTNNVTVINLLFLHSYQKDRGHYCLIKDLNKLCSHQISKSTHLKHICNRCLNYFYSETKLNEHIDDCSNYEATKIEVPSDGSLVQFKNYRATMRHPFVIYSDFEALTTRIQTCKNNIGISHTTSYQKHVPFSTGYIRVCGYNPELNRFKMYRGENPQQWLMDELLKESEFISECITVHGNVAMSPLTLTEKEKHDTCTVCYLCNSVFSKKNCKVVHHCHFTGKFINTLCNNCNLQCKNKLKILPIMYHNLARYDSKFLIEVLANVKCNSTISVIANSTEEYISFSRMYHGIQLRFIDSLKFMPSSLDKLVKNLDPGQLTITKSHFYNNDDFNLIRRKGIFPYNYLDCTQKLNDNTLPSHDHFYNDLQECNIEQTEYEHAKHVWSHFKIQTLGEYSDLYLKCDILLLADVVENYRNLTLKTYGLDAALFYGAPGLAYAASLLTSKVKLELLSDIDMILFFEKSLRGGICQVSCKYLKSNSIYSKNYDSNKPASEIMYVDANGLYPQSMSFSLPYGDFLWLDNLNILMTRINDGTVSHFYGEDLPKSCMIECDLDYPQSCHDKHKYFPFCPEHISKTGKESDKKLMLTLRNKEKYVLHLNVLLQCLKHGLILKKIHRAIEFSQKKWLKSYIDLNAGLRAQATNAFSKQQYKDLSNMCFGKMMESVRKYRSIYTVNSWEKAKKMIAKPNYKTFKIINESLIIIEMKKTSVLYDKALYVGACILDLSKTIMYNFIYDYIPKYIEPHFKIILAYSDTDSLIAKFTVLPNSAFKSIYQIIRRDAHLIFDTSDYEPDNRYQIPLLNKKKLGKFKDEMNGKIISEFVGVRAKVYSISILEDNNSDNTENNSLVKKNKGVPKSGVNKISFQDYKDAIIQDKIKVVDFNVIRSIDFTLYTQTVSKVALINFDDKRKMISRLQSLPWGHYSLSEDE